MSNHDIRCVKQVIDDQYAIYQGDSCDVIRAIPGDSIHFGIHSPPFVGLYKFSNYDRDMSNSEGDAFFQHYAFLIQELLRVTIPGRLHSVHVMQLPRNKGRDGYVGMRDFRGEVIRLWQDCGWYFHSEVCIKKDPVVAQQRTKSLRLLHKQLVKDSAMSGQGLADYVVTFRKPGANPEPLAGGFDQWIGDASLDISHAGYEADCKRRDADARAKGQTITHWPYATWVSIMVWQRYASPVWDDINQARTLQFRAGRGEKDEQHISPLQLDVIERCIDLWSAPGDTVLTPFLGIGSEVFCAVEMGRKGIGIELKPEYFDLAVRNIAKAGKGVSQAELLETPELEAAE